MFMTRIKDIATVQTGVYLKESPVGEVHYLQVKDFDANAQPTVFYPSIVRKNKIGKYLLSEGDLLFAAKGFVNFCAVFREKWGAAVASSSFLVLKIKDRNVILPEYLSWTLNREDVCAIFKIMTAGSVMPSISKATRENFGISVPAIAVQSKIVAVADLERQEQALRKQIAERRNQLISKQLIKIINQ
jgi:restriction endonuclease S subunit